MYIYIHTIRILVLSCCCIVDPHNKDSLIVVPHNKDSLIADAQYENTRIPSVWIHNKRIFIVPQNPAWDGLRFVFRGGGEA